MVQGSIFDKVKSILHQNIFISSETHPSSNSVCAVCFLEGNGVDRHLGCFNTNGDPYAAFTLELLVQRAFHSASYAQYDCLVHRDAL
jgi:hypothetical protein